MKLECIGVGDAFDEPLLGNSAFIVHGERRLLVDCGFAVPPLLFARNLDPNWIDGVYLTHFHGDHVFGLPALLTKWCVVGRERPLQIIGQFGTETRVKELLDLAYPSIRQRLPFPLTFTESEREAHFGEFVLHFAQTNHPQKNLAVRIEHGHHAIGISGDGRITPASQELLRECDIVVHDGFTFERKTPVHATACEVVEALSDAPRLQTVAFVHLERSERATRLAEYLKLGERFPARTTPRPTVLCPQPGDMLDIR